MRSIPRSKSKLHMTTHFGIVIIGDEILSGKRADKHLPKIIELLGARGLQLSFADYVGDDPARITATLARAFAGAQGSGDVVFSCGGIGATPDDHTRQCAAAALGVGLALHPDAETLIRERMRDIAKEQGTPYEPDRHDNIHRLNMGVFPLGAQIIPNPYNKIPGFSVFAERGDEQGNVGATEPTAGIPDQQGPRDWLRQTAGAAAPSGGRELHEVSDRGGSSFQQEPQNRLRRAAGAAAPLGGRELHEVSGNSSTKQGPRDWLRQTAGAAAPSGGSDPHAVGERGGVHFLPGFPVMAWPMMEWVLDTHYAHLHQKLAYSEKSVIVFGSMEAMLTPLMLEIEAAHSRVKVFSLPSVDHAEYGRHIELGVKGPPDAVNLAYPALLAGLHRFDLKFGPELVR
jgi:molybdopterin-biosynthesis enzyme MoeA-like protein